jgi:cytosine permease
MELPVGPPGVPSGLPLFHRAIYSGLPGYTGGIILLLFGLATLAPACYASWISSHRFAAHWPRLRRFTWSWICGAAVLLLICTSWAGRLEEIFGLLGAVFAPAVGAMVGDALLQRGRWSGVRTGWNLAGIVAWAGGLAVGLAPHLGLLVDWPRARAFQPASLYAFVASSVLFLLMTSLGPVRPLAILPELPHEADQTQAGAIGGKDPDAGVKR